MPDQLTWYISRASGLVAWALLAVAIVWGLLLSSRVLERRPSPASLFDMHRHLGWLTAVLTGVHVAALYTDDFVEFTPLELVVPFLSDYDTAGTALGVVSLWLLVVVQISSSRRGRPSARLWRALHMLSIPLAVTATIHGVMVGTDLASPLVVVVGMVLGAELGLVLLLRAVWGRRQIGAALVTEFTRSE